MERRQFLLNLVVGGLSLTAAKKAFASGTNPELRITISRNHGHELVILGQDFKDGADHDYDIQGDSGHGHTLHITKEQFLLLLQGQPVQIQSSTDFGHAHMIDIRII